MQRLIKSHNLIYYTETDGRHPFMTAILKPLKMSMKKLVYHIITIFTNFGQKSPKCYEQLHHHTFMYFCHNLGGNHAY